VLPALVVFGVFVVAPMIDGAWISLFAWDGVTVGHWVGLSNYRKALVDPLVREAFGHSLVLVGFYAVLPITIGLFLTALMSHARVRGSTAVRTIIFLPQVLAAVVIGVAWKWLYDPSGPINTLLGAVGLSSLEHSWLGDFSTALPAVGVIGTWVTTGLCLVLFVAGVQRIPLSRYEAARVDGAGPVREFLAVTLPGLRNELAVAMSLSVITALRAFDIIFVTTKGGPGTATTVPSLLIYQRAFITGEVGSAAAIGAIMGAIILLLSVVITRVVEERR
jgi:raffinose/stachyose/melibiose transport system permease protein